MQANKIQEGAKDLIEKLINLDPIEAHSAINQYFDTHAILQSREVNIQGADRIKKQFDLVNHVFKSSELVGQPKWSEEQQTITFTYRRQIECPELFWPLNSLPLINKLSRASKTIHFDGSLHLNPDGRPIAGDPHQLLVTKYDVERRERAPLENLVPYYLLRPFFSLVSNVIASVAAIVLAYPFTPTGIVHMVTSLINNFWLWFYDKVADGVEGKLPPKPVWTDGAGSDLPIGDQLNSLLASAEDQAKKLGLPVERAKELAQEAYNNAGNAFGNASERVQQAQQIARQKVQEAARYAQDTSKQVQKNAPKNVDEAKGKAEKASQQAKDKAVETARDAKKKAGQTANDASGKAGKKASEAKDKAEGAAKETQGNVQEATNHAFQDSHGKQGSNNTDSAQRDDLPTTPLGGTDPLAPGAPSYAGAVVEE